MTISKTGVLASLAMTTALAFTGGCGGAGEEGATDEGDAVEVGQAEDALVFPHAPTPKACLVAPPANPASFTFRCGAQGFRRAGVFDGGTSTVAFPNASNP